MKKLLVLAMTCMLTFGTSIMPVCASSLDDVIGQNTEVQTEVPAAETPNTTTENTQQVTQEQPTQDNSYDGASYNDQYMQNLKDATNLSQPSAGAAKINASVKKVASFIVQVLSYAVTAFLVVRVLIDICYITLPFTRAFLANGYSGNGQAGGAGMGGMGMGMQGGMGGMGMGGMSGGYGMGGYGMHRGYGMGGMGMGGMQGGMGGMQQPGASSAAGRTQWVSGAALNAVAAESMMGQDGKAVSPLKAYAKDMTIVLIITPVLLTLAITGALTQLGFLIGDVISRAVASIGNMM